MPRPVETNDLHFPKAGQDVAQAFGRQPTRQVDNGEYARTTRKALNVRAIEAATGRSRGASRHGVSRYAPDPVPTVNGEWCIQSLDVIVTAGSGAMQTSQLGRIVSAVIVAEGNLFRLIPTDDPDDRVIEAVTNSTDPFLDPPLNFSGLVRSASNSQKMWFADGVNWVYYVPATNEVKTWAATAGQLPLDSDGNGPTLIANWRGRILLAGYELDPQNLFGSKVLDPTNWEFFPEFPSAVDAFAGNNPGMFGLVGDVITCLIPYSDDKLIIGCDSQVVMLQGDPRAGGQLHNITTAIGMAFGAPWCMDPRGNVYFYSNRCGVYRMNPAGGEPEEISTSIRTELQQVDTGSNGVCMAWDDRFDGLWLFVSPLTEPGEGNNWYWDRRNNGWYKDRFKNNKMNPLVCCVYDGNLPSDRVVLLGSWDGYVRAEDPTAETDDGEDIESEVWIGPLLTKDLDDVTLRAIQVVLGETSGTVTWAIHEGATAEAAFDSDPVETGQVYGGGNLNSFDETGRNAAERVKVANHAIYIKLTSTERWCMESIRATTTLNGKIRQRGR